MAVWTRQGMQIALLILVGVMLAVPTTADTETIAYTVRSGDSLHKIASIHRRAAGYYASVQLLDDIRENNQISGTLIRPGQQLLIPVRAPRPYAVVTDRVVDGAPVRGIYLTGPLCGSEYLFGRVDRFIEAGGNAVVFDVKDADGGVSFRSQQELASWGKGRRAPVISHLDELLGEFQKRGLHVTARVACFLDGDLGRARPDLALHNDQGEPWAERDQIWMDPSQPEVHDYVIGLALEMAAAGVDEVQFDYVRFPTNGWVGDVTGDAASTAARRRGVITGFLRKADEELALYPVDISDDLYGIMAWGRLADRAVTGQHIADIAQYVDVICPMVYPSHYKRGYMGYDDPADHPGFFVREPTERFVRQANGQARVRPWLQAFPWRVDGYDAEYVAAQIDAAFEGGADGWLLWNPASRYTVALPAVSRESVSGERFTASGSDGVGGGSASLMLMVP